MYNTKHYITNVATGAALSTLVPTNTVNERLLVTSTFIGGAMLGQLLGPDLDLPNSKPTRNGGYELLLIISFILSLVNFGFMNNTILVLGLLLSICLLVAKRFNPSQNLVYPDLVIGAVGLSYIVMSYSYNLLTSSSFYFFIFSMILIYTKKHRGISHSLIMMILLGVSGYFTSLNINNETLGNFFNYLIIGYVSGYFTHIFMDWLGGKPIYFLAPFDWKLKPLKLYVTTTKEGKAKETLVVMVYCGLSFIIFINMI